VENRVGAITVTGADTDKCRLEITVTAHAETEEEAQAMAQAVSMKYDSSDSRIFVKPVKPNDDDWKDIDVAFEITVPRRASLQLSADVGAVHLRDIQGQVAVKTNVGAIATENVAGDVDLETNVGEIRFVAPDDLSAKITAATNIGAIQSNLPIEVSGKAQNGRFGPALGNSARGTVGSGERTVKLKSNVGAISIRSKGPADASLPLKKISTSHVTPAAATVSSSSSAVAMSGASGGSATVSLSSGGTRSDAVGTTVTLDGTSGIRKVESIKESQEGDQFVVHRTESQTLRLAAGTVLDVANENGTITITGTDGDTCRAQALLTIKGPAAETTRMLSKAVALNVMPKKGKLALGVAGPDKIPARHSYRVDLQVMVPRHTDLNVMQEDGDVKIAEVAGPVKLLVEDGNILCQRLTGELKVKLEDGDLKIDGCTSPDCKVAMEDGNIDCSNVSGNLDVVLEDGQVKIVYSDNVPEHCAVRVLVEDGNIQFSAPSEMFPADDTAKVRKAEEGAEWHTTLKTGQGSRDVTLLVDDGEIKVDQR